MSYALGHWNTLKVTRFSDYGAFLDGGETEILMPRKYVPEECKAGDFVRAFVYLDQQDRLVATTEKAKAEEGDFAFLRVAWVNRYGAFLDWGLTKDLFVPFREQKRTMEQDNVYIVYIYIDDKTGRLVATAKIDRYLTHGGDYKAGQEVEIMIWQKTLMGYKVIVNNQSTGLIYQDEIFQSLRIGDRMMAVIKGVREDGKIDVALQHSGKQHIEDFSPLLLKALQDAGGHLPFSDKSSPEEIADKFQISKKAFKKTLGLLYKQHKILLSDSGISLVEEK